ncbi:hypothetical protein HMPREF1221_00640 [Treponema socranskii subsp. paredis ATCC 35535]|nr:hypothetical protein HMPREF1221_00640 [Treponema socranskii subsp. paredis ATCC 35535]
MQRIVQKWATVSVLEFLPFGYKDNNVKNGSKIEVIAEIRKNSHSFSEKIA